MVWGKARGLAAPRVPSMSKTVQEFPQGSSSPPVCSVCRERPREQITEKEGAQRFDWRLGQRCEIARERWPRRELISVKQGHERDGKRLESKVGTPAIGTLAADRVAKEDRKTNR